MRIPLITISGFACLAIFFQNCSPSGFTTTAEFNESTSVVPDAQTPIDDGQATPPPTVNQPLQGTKFGEGLLVKNQYGRIYVKSIGDGDHYDVASTGMYDAISYEFSAAHFWPNGGVGLVNLASVTYSGASQFRQMTISTTPGDSESAFCQTRMGSEVSKYVAFYDYRISVCKLQPGVKYYLTIRNPLPCSSSTGDSCKFHFVSSPSQ